MSDRWSLLIGSLACGILLFNAFAAPQPVHIDQTHKPSFVQMNYSFSTPHVHYPDMADDPANTPWGLAVPYTNIFTSPTTAVMFVQDPGSSVPDGDAFFRIVSTDYQVQPTICPAVPNPTVCPFQLTVCQVVPTQCPRFKTQCPVEPTVCPWIVTQCVLGNITECAQPGSETECAYQPTVCPFADGAPTICPHNPQICAPWQWPAD